MICTIVFCAIIMLLAKNIFAISIAKTSYNKFVEIIPISAFLVTVFSAWWGYSSERRQREKVAAAKFEQQNASEIMSLKNQIYRQEAVDGRIERLVLSQQEEIKEMRSHLGRLTAQIHQQQTAAIIMRRLEKLEDLSADYPQMKK